MLRFKKITIHCSATKPSMNTTIEDIRRWHVEDNGWSDIGYHMVIERDGELKHGRSILIDGAHVRGHNSKNIGICLVGGMSEEGKPEFNYTFYQMETLQCTISELQEEYGYDIEVVGHNDLDPNKTCPNFNVKAWWGE